MVVEASGSVPSGGAVVVVVGTGEQGGMSSGKVSSSSPTVTTAVAVAVSYTHLTLPTIYSV